jgi:hypothetical protein
VCWSSIQLLKKAVSQRKTDTFATLPDELSATLQGPPAGLWRVPEVTVGSRRILTHVVEFHSILRNLPLFGSAQHLHGAYLRLTP